MQTISVKVQGETPLLIGRPLPEELIKKIGKKSVNKILPDERLYKFPDGEPYIPFNYFYGACRWEAKGIYPPGKQRGNCLVLFCANCSIAPDRIPFVHYVKSPEPFGRPLRRKDGNVVWAETVMFTEWELDFNILIRDGFPIEHVESIIKAAGQTSGIGVWTPRHGGRFGIFKVMKFK